MSASELIRWGGLSAVVGGFLLVITDLWNLVIQLLGGTEPFSETASSPSFAISSGISLLSAVLVLFGLVGLNLCQSGAGGVLLGRVAFLVAFLGTALVVGPLWFITFAVPSLAMEAPALVDAEGGGGPLDLGFIVSSAVLSVGWALFGVSALRARIYPRWAAIVLIIAAVLLFLPIPGSGLLFGVVVALLGLFALSGANISVGEPSRVR